MTKREFYLIGLIAKRVRRQLLSKLGVDSQHTGLCGAAAIPLCAELKAKGFDDCIIVYGNVKVDVNPKMRAHYWVELKDYVIDITADQFNPFQRGQHFNEVVIAPYMLLPRFSPARKDCIKLEGNLNGFLHEWMETIR